MQAALKLHPEWNGDWAMPPNVRKAEIDSRDGSLIRELDGTEALNTRDDDNKANRKPSSDPTDGAEQTADTQTQPEQPVTTVPAEFRRVELFVSGTIPTKKMPAEDEIVDYDPETGEPILKPTPTPKPTPVNGTWEDGTEPPGAENKSDSNSDPRKDTVSVLICPLTGMRATSNCPNAERKTYRRGTEPKDFCTFHVNPPK
jgi:hypothetical protein